VYFCNYSDNIFNNIPDSKESLYVYSRISMQNMARQRALHKIAGHRDLEMAAKDFDKEGNKFVCIFWTIVCLVSLWPLIHYTNSFDIQTEELKAIIRNYTAIYKQSIKNVSSVRTWS